MFIRKKAASAKLTTSNTLGLMCPLAGSDDAITPPEGGETRWVNPGEFLALPRPATAYLAVGPPSDSDTNPTENQM
jgi:hypothetical protein